MSHTFAGRIHLGDLYGVEYETREINGIEEECIVIPIQPNGMHKSKKFGVSIPIRVAEKKTRGHSFFYDQTHYITLDLRKKPQVLERLQELGYAHPLMYIGYAYLENYRPLSNSEKNRNRVSLDEAMNTE